REDEPRRRRADGLFDDAADVVGGAAEVAQDDRGGAPVGDEGEGDAADDDDLGRAGKASPSGRRARALGSGHGAVPKRAGLSTGAGELPRPAGEVSCRAWV